MAKFMRSGASVLAITIVASLLAAPLAAQEGRSVGRGWEAPPYADDIVGPDGKGHLIGPGYPPPGHEVIAARNGAVPEGITPLEVDIFSTKDFYQDVELWTDPLYFRCNSPAGIETQYGATHAEIIGDNPPYSGAWGYCDRDYPREHMVSPYPFKTAQEHYEALLAETTEQRGGPIQHTSATVPDWSGVYIRNREKVTSWYYGAIQQIPTLLSLLTPEYQKRFVQQAYHSSGNNSSQWPGSYCWPDGFMRRVAQYGGGEPRMVVTPDYVQILNTSVQSLMTQIHIGREFDMSGAVPRLGDDVPRWYGETIGYWDEDALITWTSNVQSWTQHGSFEFSNQMQSVEIYTPRRDEAGEMIGMTHEVVLYDPAALVEPVRIVQTWDLARDLHEGTPFVFIQCIQSIFPVDGVATPLAPGAEFNYIVPDIFGRPWAQNWERFHEEGMQRPDSDQLFGF